MEFPGPVTAADVRTAVTSAVRALTSTADQDWQVPAGGLTWSCWETAEHTADDLFAYAAQLGPRHPPQETCVPFGGKRRPGGPALTVHVEPSAGVPGLLQVLESCGGLLAAVVEVTPPNRRAWHPMGLADPEGFAAMGVVEVLVHTHDLSAGLGASWTPPANLCDRVLRRLFPQAPLRTDRWETLLWATGRAGLPGRPRLTEWRWDANPRFELTTGTVREWHAGDGWGVIEGPAVPGGCWAGFSAVAVPGYRELAPGQPVTLRAERADQDGFPFRAVKVWPGDTEPPDTEPSNTEPGANRSGAYRSILTLTFDPPD